MPHVRLIGSLVLLGMVTGCGSRACPQVEATAGGEAPAAESLTAYVPGDAAAALLLRADLVEALLRPLRADPDLVNELGPYLEERVGFDLLATEAVVAFVDAPTLAGDGDLALLLRMPGPPTLNGETLGEHRGVPLVRFPGSAVDAVAAAIDAGLVMGTEAGVRRAIDVAQGIIPSAEAGTKMEGLATGDAARASLVVLLGPEALSEVSGGLTAMFGVRSARLDFGLSGDIELRVEGDPGGLARAEQLIAAALSEWLADVEQARVRAHTSEDVWAGVAGIVGYHLSRHAIEELTPVREDDALVVRYHVEASRLLLTTIGVGAAVAVPTYLEYAAQVRAAAAPTAGLQGEAVAGLRSLFGGIEASVADVRPTRRWEELRRMRLTPTPSSTPCGAPVTLSEVDRQHLEAFGWTGATQVALSYELGTPDALGLRGRFPREPVLILRARGDADCDGVPSVFLLPVYVDQDGTLYGEDELVADDPAE